MRIKRLSALALALLLCALAAAACGEQEARRVVYLTFDDGPEADTPELAALLEELGVPATFFFVGAKVKEFPQEAKLIYDRGYAIGCHTMYHDYITEDKERSRRDYERFLAAMRECVAEDFSTDLYRFPGGSTGYPGKMRRFIAGEGWAWFDWNAKTGDTHAGVKPQDLYDLAVREAGDQEVVILLAHEGKRYTREILPELVGYFRGRGYEFRMLSTSEEERRILARSSAPMMLPETERE